MESRLILQNIVRFAVLTLVQILILNNINISGYAIPYLYLLFILMLPTGMGKIAMLLAAFVCGLAIDVFSNMLGFHTFSCTMVAFARILFADRILTRNEPVVISTPSIYTVKTQYFIGYLLVLTAIFYLTFFSLELFDSHGFWRLLLSITLSTLLTVVLALISQILFMKRPHE
ncbi:MAG: rod shape-determining protein mred [bacterium P3]|nr:MAG: rod shape-determining protein mred [bacterium P3]KWW41480.1 MAG: rod shape-determining protein mred [bacterium F083]